MLTVQQFGSSGPGGGPGSGAGVVLGVIVVGLMVATVVLFLMQWHHFRSGRDSLASDAERWLRDQSGR